MPIRDLPHSISHKTQRSLTEDRDLELPPSAPRDLRLETEMLTSRQRRLENRVAEWGMEIAKWRETRVEIRKA